MNVITKLALSRIKGKKTRSAVICTAIFLTIVLFMTVVSISSNLLTGYGLMMRLAMGTDYHGYLRSAAFTLTAEELRDEMRKSNDIKEAVISSNVTKYALKESMVAESVHAIRAIESQEDLAHFYTTVTEGAFPQTDEEILVNPTYFPDAKVGDTLTLYYAQEYDDYSMTACADFKVSGLIESSADTQMQVAIRYSDTLEKTYGFGAKYTVYFTFDNTLNLTGKYDSLVNETLAVYKEPDFERFGALNTAYLSAVLKEGLDPANIFLIVFAVAVVFYCSFLLIYNIYSIALVQDMQSFGLLNVIGTTHRQLRRMICIQSVILYALTLPFGLIAGYFIGWKLLAPVLFSMGGNGLTFEFSPWILVFTILLTMFTLLWSAVRPLKKLKSLTPIATVEYSPAADLPKRYVRRKNYRKKNITPNTGRLAKYTISRNRKKTVMTALSMSISVILFMLIETIADYGLAYTYDNLQKTDYVIKPAYEYYYTGTTDGRSDTYYMDEGISLTEEYVSALKNNTLTEKVWKIRTAMVSMDTPAGAKEMLRTWKETCAPAFWSPLQQQILDGQMETVVISIPDEFFSSLRDNDLKEIGDDYSDGWVLTKYSPDRTLTKDSYAPYGYFEEGETVVLGQNRYQVHHADYSLAAYHICGYLSTYLDRPVIYMPEHHFLEEFGEGSTYALLVDAKEDCYDLMRTEIERLSEDFMVAVDTEIKDKYDALYDETYTNSKEIVSSYAYIDGRLDGLAEMEENMLAIRTVGYSLAGMIFLIGALNIVNTALSSAAERKREFAMLEAVGMTDKQMMRMLLAESLYSGGTAVVITLCVGFPSIALIVNTAMDALVPLSWMSGLIMLAVCIAVSVLSGLAVFRLTKSAAVVERIKVE